MSLERLREIHGELWLAKAEIAKARGDSPSLWVAILTLNMLGAAKRGRFTGEANQPGAIL